MGVGLLLAAAEEYDQLVAAARDRAVKVRLKAVPQRTFDQLRDNHPAREEKPKKEEELSQRMPEENARTGNSHFQTGGITPLSIANMACLR